MNNKRNRKLLFAVLCSCAIAAMGQTATDTLRLSLDDCIRIALNENPTIKVAEMEITKVATQRKRCWGNYCPPSLSPAAISAHLPSRPCIWTPSREPPSFV